jgi:hypothetical protein
MKPSAYLYTHWASNTRLQPTEKLVLICLTDAMDNASRSTRLRMDTIALRTSLSRQAIVNALRLLEAENVVRAEQDAPTAPARYTFPIFDALAKAKKEGDHTFECLTAIHSEHGQAKAMQRAREAERAHTKEILDPGKVVPLFKS